MEATPQLLDSINHCLIDAMQRVGSQLDPGRTDSCTAFSSHVKNVEAAILYNYQVTAYTALRKADPKDAAQLWKEMATFCENAIKVLKDVKDIYPHCGTPELYNLALDYWSESHKRHEQNLKDSECASQIPAGLFPIASEGPRFPCV